MNNTNNLHQQFAAVEKFIVKIVSKFYRSAHV